MKMNGGLDVEIHALWTSAPVEWSVKVKDMLQHGQSASLSWCHAPIWDPRPIPLRLSFIIFFELWDFLCGAPSLTRGRICSLQLPLGLASAVLLGSRVPRES
jgi:hypothetical protein